MNLEETTRAIRDVLGELEGRLPNADIENARVFLDAGEPEIALENLCAQIYEYEISISSSLYRLIRTAGEALGLAATDWTDLTVTPDE